MFTPEKRDIDISKLFEWGRTTEIRNKLGEVIATPYIRLVGDADINKARVFAIRCSAELRKKLRDENSDEFIAFIVPIEDLPKEKLIDFLLINRSKELHKSVGSELQIKFPKEPSSTATLEEQERYQKEVDEYPDKLRAEIKSVVERKIEEKRKAYKKESHKFLHDEYKNDVINFACENEMYGKYRDACVYFGTYEDESQSDHMFNDLGQFLNLPTYIKDQFVEAYDLLELDSDTLKK